MPSTQMQMPVIVSHVPQSRLLLQKLRDEQSCEIVVEQERVVLAPVIRKLKRISAPFKGRETYGFNLAQAAGPALVTRTETFNA